MIQELLGGAGLEGLPSASASPSASPSPSPSSSTTTTPTSSSTSENQNLRCPRCDSSNTKFCYYNNYNLTQPRHFCKTCRRYWTKGGALRNVPIGGGCRKNKSSSLAAPVGKASATTGRLKTPEFGKSGLVSGSSNPVLWASPQNSHLLSLLRATQNPNSNPMSNSVAMKEEAGVMIGSHMASESAVRTLGLDALSLQVPSIGLCSSFWRNNQQEVQQQQQQQQQQQMNHFHQQQNGFNIHGEVQNSGIQELYQRLRSSANYNYHDHSVPLVLSNVASSSSPSSAILESAPAAGGELGYWNPTLSWSDHLPTTNGAYP